MSPPPILMGQNRPQQTINRLLKPSNNLQQRLNILWRPSNKLQQAINNLLKPSNSCAVAINIFYPSGHRNSSYAYWLPLYKASAKFNQWPKKMASKVTVRQPITKNPDR